MVTGIMSNVLWKYLTTVNTDIILSNKLFVLCCHSKIGENLMNS